MDFSQHNPKDPLGRGPDSRLALYREVSLRCDGFSGDDVLNVAGNLLINVLRQVHSTRRGAEHGLDEIVARIKKSLLDDHYDGQGRRRGVYPYVQNIDMPLSRLKQ